MLLNQLHWLDVLEYVSYGITAISLLIALNTNSFIYTLIGLTITLGLNIINRVRAAHASISNRKIVTGTVKQLQHQWSEELHPLAQKTTQATETMSQNLAVVEENLFTLEQSLNGIIQYLNNHALRERIERIERSYLHLKKEIINILPETSSPVLRDIEPPPTDLPTSLPSIHLVPHPAATISEPQWNCLHQFQAHQDAIASMSISADGQLIATASWDHKLKIWDLKTGQIISTIKAHDQAVLAVVFTTHDTEYHLASGSFDHTVKLWSLAGKQLKLDLLLTAHTGSVHALIFAHQAALLLSGSYDQSVKQWQVENGEMTASSYEALGAIYALALDPLEQLIASAGGDGTVNIWKVGSGEKISHLGGNISSIKSLAISPDGQILGAGCVDGSVKLWQFEQQGIKKTVQPIRTFKAHQGQVQALVFSENGEFLISGGADGLSKIWHPSHQDAIATLSLTDDSRPPAIFTLALSKDGQYLAAGGGNGMIKIWQKNQSEKN
ncbi:WD40 repeat domain-containing protein [Chroococcus sp. FPU101]|uniref:WD40 repeat domain-containing protein n=1 Tax=Chroococcus sp. FPU101 TaxID=1974212 RepID=UPI001A8C520C|nr:WD40 repeat domain-containing protein [Chroococcus sp. FPU101]GFE67959.1 WD-40 repeat protein [Chroococcus sp. FPU101]